MLGLWDFWDIKMRHIPQKVEKACKEQEWDYTKWSKLINKSHFIIPQCTCRFIIILYIKMSSFWYTVWQINPAYYEVWHKSSHVSFTGWESGNQQKLTMKTMWGKTVEMCNKSSYSYSDVMEQTQFFLSKRGSYSYLL